MVKEKINILSYPKPSSGIDKILTSQNLTYNFFRGLQLCLFTSEAAHSFSLEDTLHTGATTGGESLKKKHRKIYLVIYKTITSRRGFMTPRNTALGETSDIQSGCFIPTVI